MKKSFLEFTYGCVSIKTPVYTFTWKNTWPSLVLTWGMHGNEINGVIVCNKLKQIFIEENIEESLQGTITIVPILNPLWFEQMERNVPIDGKDLNRCFWVDDTTQKSFSIAYAQYLLEHLRKNAQHGIDIHDAWGRSALIPHPRINLCEDVSCNNCTHEMAKWFDSKIVLERVGDLHMLATHSYNSLRIPVMTIELGWGQLLFPEFHQETIRGIYNILRGYGYLPGSPVLTQEKQWYLIDRDYYPAREAWHFTSHVQLWTYITEWQSIWTLYYPFSDVTETIIAKDAWFLFSLWYGHQIPAWSNLFSLLSEERSQL